MPKIFMGIEINKLTILIMIGMIVHMIGRWEYFHWYVLWDVVIGWFLCRLVSFKFQTN